MNAKLHTVAARVPVGHQPRGLSLSSDGRHIYIANSWDDTVSMIDASGLKVVATLHAGFEPTSALPDREDKTLYVANRLSNDVSGIDLSTGEGMKRLAAGRGANSHAV